MAERSRGGGLGWFVVGVLAGIALTLFSLVFINLRGGRHDAESRSGADDAAAAAIQADPAAAPAPMAPAPAAEAPPPAKPSQPVTAADTAAAERAAAQAADDAQMRDDAAAVGDTSRASPPQ